MQLRPKAEVYRLTKESRKGYDLDVSMFERVSGSIEREGDDHGFQQCIQIQWYRTSYVLIHAQDAQLVVNPTVKGWRCAYCLNITHIPCSLESLCGFLGVS